MKTIKMKAEAVEMMTDGWLKPSQVVKYDRYGLKPHMVLDTSDGTIHIGMIIGSTFYLKYSAISLDNVIKLAVIEVLLTNNNYEKTLYWMWQRNTST